MKFRHLLAFPFIAATLTVLLFVAIPDAQMRRIPLRTEIEVVKILALVGCLAAAKAFEPGEYLRRGWLLQAMCYAFLLLRDLIFGVWFERNSPHFGEQCFESALILIANVGAVSGIWILSRTWQVAGIALPGSPLKLQIVRYAGIVIALSIAGPALFLDLHAVANGHVRVAVNVASDLGDVISLSLIVPVMLTAVALRGGLLIWPWAFLAASQLGWLLYDASRLMGHFLALDSTYATLMNEIFRCLACTFGFAAGMAQRTVTAPDASPALQPEPAS